MNKKCIFTCITGNYDRLMEPSVITPGWDYICFSDDLDITSRYWDIRPLHDKDMKIKCPKRRANSVIMKYYEYISEQYDVCIIIDGNMKVSKNLDDFLDDFKFDYNTIDLMIGQHPTRNCVYKEAKEIIRLRKDDKNSIQRQVDILKKENYPINNGLFETGVLVISRKSKKCIDFFTRWWYYYNILPSKRDQMTINYTIWKNTHNSFNMLECDKNEDGKTPRERRPFHEYFIINNSHNEKV